MKSYTSQTYISPYLNWQKMSAYSVDMPTACRTVTRKVNSFPNCRCSGKSSSFVSDATELSPRPLSASPSISVKHRVSIMDGWV